jgi:hypothetical protein
MPALLLTRQIMLSVASVKRNSYGPVVSKVPTGTVLRRSVRLLKPPNPHTATTSSTSRRKKIEP